MADNRFVTVDKNEITKSINSKLSSLKQNNRFYDWKTCPLLCEKLSDLLDLIKMGIKNPEDGVALIVKFLRLDEYICDRCDDSDGGVGYEFNSHAIEVLVPFAKEFKDKDKLTDIVYQLINKDDYGCHNGVLDNVADILPEDKICELFNRKYDRSFGSNYIYQKLACSLNDASLLISLLESTEHGICERHYKDIAKCYLASGNIDEALKWTLKISEGSYGQKELLEEIYEKKHDTNSLRSLYEESYLCYPSEETGKKLISICGMDEFQKIKDSKIEAIKKSVIFSTNDMEFLLDQQLFDDAQEYLYARRNKVNDIYFSSTFIRRIKKYCSPLLQTIVFRVPVNYFLNNAKSKYYDYAAKLLKDLIKIAPSVDDWKDVQSHEEYFNELYQKHYRKKAFWRYFE